ncbi:MAG: DUF1254 domain-containing protein [Burkholderiaceae bacterium]
MRSDPRFALGRSIGYAAFVWGYPLIESLRTCALQTRKEGTAAWSSPIDRLRHTRNVATDADRDVVTPANDLLYTTGWINLADGPRMLSVPARAEQPERYFVLALYDAWTNNFANPGFRESPREGEVIALVGPGTPADAPLPAGARPIRSPTNLVWLIGRVLCGAGDDVQAARDLQSKIGLECAAGTDHGRLPQGVIGWVGPTDDTVAAVLANPGQAETIAAAFFTNLCRALYDQAFPEADTGLAAWFSRAGLIASPEFAFEQLPPAMRAGLTEGLTEAVAWIQHASRSRRAKPWAANYGIGRYGTEYLVRALTAFVGLGALAGEEALYAKSDFDENQQALDGRQRYVQRFEPGELPPVDGFWSVTLYDADRFLYRNPFGRHSIGDRTQGLKPDADGGLSLIIGHEPPAQTANWLPAPPGPFYLTMRLYVPRAQARTWQIPPLRPVNR